MKIKINISKTVQETQYEPFKLDVEVEKEVPEPKSKEEFDKALGRLERALEDFVDGVILERLKNIDVAVGEDV